MLITVPLPATRRPTRFGQGTWKALAEIVPPAAPSATDLAEQLEQALFDYLAQPVPGTKKRTCGSEYKGAHCVSTVPVLIFLG